MIFLPPNTTGSLQPSDQGIIANLKVQYRKRVLTHLVTQMETVSNCTELKQKVTYLDTILWLKDAIDAISETCVKNCFKKAGFGFMMQEHFDEIPVDFHLRELRVLLNRVDFYLPPEDYVYIYTENESDFNLRLGEGNDKDEQADDKDEE